MTIFIKSASGFIEVPADKGFSTIAFISKPNVAGEYSLGEPTKITGLCSYQFLSSAGLVRGVLITSPKIHTVLSPVMLKIGSCPGPFTVNQNLQQVGLLLYESPDSSIIVIPAEVKSSLLVEVDT